MCVIICAEKQFPPLQLLQQAEKSNPDGGGIAWLTERQVEWKKNLSAKEIYQLGRNLPLPSIIHFRLASSGGKSPFLCHPFPISRNVPLNLEGKTKGRVLFHNGHWAQWKEICLQTIVKTQRKFLDGICSDSRAIAWLTYIYGTNILNLLADKIAILSPNGIRIFGDGWQEYAGLKVSNIFFTYEPKYFFQNKKGLHYGY